MRRCSTSKAILPDGQLLRIPRCSYSTAQCIRLYTALNFPNCERACAFPGRSFICHGHP